MNCYYPTSPGRARCQRCGFGAELTDSEAIKSHYRATGHKMIAFAEDVSAAQERALEEFAETSPEHRRLVDAYRAETQRKIGLRAMVTVRGARVLAVKDLGGWSTFGTVEGYSGFGDDEVTDIEPVVVLTAEDVAKLHDLLGGTEWMADHMHDFFTERGLDV